MNGKVDELVRSIPYTIVNSLPDGPDIDYFVLLTDQVAIGQLIVLLQN